MDTLPVEVIHRIFDHLDAETILLSLRTVCQAFRSMVQSYDRYNINLHLISKWKFSLLCRLIQPENIISLTLSNDERTSDQIQRFLSFFSLRQFTRLHSLTLLQMHLIQLETILENCQLQFLHSFFYVYPDQYERNNTKSAVSLSPFFSQSPLRQLHLAMPTHLIETIPWPIHSMIQSLTIHSFTSIDIDKLYEIFQCSPHLHTLSLSRLPGMNSVKNFNFPQLKSLTIDETYSTIEQLEMFLSMAPSLTFLRLIGGASVINGKRWEDFLEKNLPHLKTFEFYFAKWEHRKHTREDLQSIITSFSTPFWIEQKSWFVTCEYCELSSETIHVSSLPFCKSSTRYQSQSEKISLSTYPMMINNDLRMIDNIHLLNLLLNASLAQDILEKKITMKEVPFVKVTDLQLAFHRDWPMVSLLSLGVLIDISRIVRMTLDVARPKKWNKDFWADMGCFFECAHHLSSLVVSYPSIDYLHPNLPRSIQHLEMWIDDHHRIPVILERCPHLSTIILCNVDFSVIKKIFDWFNNYTIDSTCCRTDRRVSVWLGKINLNSKNPSIIQQHLNAAFSVFKAKKDKIRDFISRN